MKKYTKSASTAMVSDSFKLQKFLIKIKALSFLRAYFFSNDYANASLIRFIASINCSSLVA